MPIVSSDEEPLILVEELDRVIGSRSKLACHKGNGVLHRAFSVFLFSDDGDVLLQRRSQEKLLWPGFWSNACCSHPRVGEELLEAVHRRMAQELGVSTAVEFAYKFTYHAQFDNVGQNMSFVLYGSDVWMWPRWYRIPTKYLRCNGSLAKG